MRHKIGVLFIVLLLVLVCATAFTACNGGKYQMQDFVVDFEEFSKTYEVGDQIDLTKIKMYATFSDGSQEAIPLDKVTIKVDGEQISLNEINKITATEGTKIVEIKYSNVVRSVTLKVNAKHIAVLTGVEADDSAASFKHQYNVKDTVSFEGLVVKAIYDGYDKRVVALTDENVSFVINDGEIVTSNNLSRITDEPGQKAIHVRYGSVKSTDTFTITVVDVLDEVAINVPNNFKTNYKVGDSVALNTITASAIYRSGTKVNNLDVSFYLGTVALTDFTTLTTSSGTKVVTAKASYQNVNGEKDIAIQVATYVEAISVATTGVQLNYVVDDEISIDNFSDVKINVTYAGSAPQEISLTAFGVECVNANDAAINFDALTKTAGTKVITVKYQGKTASFSVVVAEKESVLQSLTVTSQPTAASYTAGSTGVSLEGLVITGVYKDGTTPDDVISYADFGTKGVKLYYNDELITSLDNLTKITPIGSNPVAINVNYLNKTASFNLTVTNSVTALQIVAQPTKVAYLLDEDFDMDGLRVKAIKSFGEEEISLSDLAFYNGTVNVTSDLDALTATAGQKTITIKFEGQEITFNINVSDYVLSLSLQGTTSFETNVNKTTGSVFESFTGLQVYANYKSGSSTLVETGLTFSGNSITVPGTKTITVSYAGVENNGITLVVKDILNSIQVDSSSIPTKIVKNGEVEKFLVSLRVLGNYEYKGQEEINILQNDGQSFLYGVVSFELRVGENYQALSQLELDNIALVSGDREVKINYLYNGYTRSAEFVINVLVSGNGVDEFSLPQSLVKYNATLAYGRANQGNVNSQAFEGALFVNDVEDYIVGNDNAYRFVPTFNQIDIISATKTTLTSFAASSTIYLVDGSNATPLEATQTGTYTVEWSHGGVKYVTETTNENKYQFTVAAENKSFKLSVLPDPNEFVYDPDDINPVEWTVKVEKGYNIYDSREICLLEQPSEATRNQVSGKYPNGRKFWDSIKSELGLSGKRYSSIILHDNLVVTKDALPQEFWFTLPSNYEVYYKYGDTKYRPEDVPVELGGPLERSFLWDQEWGLLQYDMQNGENFAIHGNFFDIDLSKLPLVCSFEPSGIEHPDGRDAYYMDYMSKISFLDVRGWDVRYTNGVNQGWRYLTDLGETPTESDENDEHFSFDNFMVRGNASPKQLLLDDSTVRSEGMADNPVYGGGIIFVKTHYCHSDLYNINANSCFISFFSRDYTVCNYTKLKSYDSYLNAIYALGETEVNVTNCHFKRAGGPLMIVTQQTDDLKNDGELNTSDYIEIPRVIIDSNSKLENFITGEEVWFDIFAPGQVPTLKALDGLLNYYFGKTFLQNNKFNLICVSSQGQCYVSYLGDKLDRLSGAGKYKDGPTPTTTYDYICMHNVGGAPAFSVGDTMCSVGISGGDYYLQNVAQTELHYEEGQATIQEFSGAHGYISIHVGTGGEALGIFTGLYSYAG